MLVLGVVTLVLEFIASIGVFLIHRFGSGIDAMVLAMWSWPLLALAIVVLVLGLISIHKTEKRKKAITTTILGGAAIIGFLLYAIHLGFLIGTGELIFYYVSEGF